MCGDCDTVMSWKLTCVTYQWQPEQCSSEHACACFESAWAEQRVRHEELVPGSRRESQRPDTSPIWTPPTSPTAGEKHRPSAQVPH